MNCEVTYAQVLFDGEFLGDGDFLLPRESLALGLFLSQIIHEILRLGVEPERESHVRNLSVDRLWCKSEKAFGVRSTRARPRGRHSIPGH